MYELLPELYGQMVANKGQFLLYQKYNQQKKHRLYQARGSLQCIYLRVCRAVLLAASRPYDVEGRLVKEAMPMYRQWEDFPVFS